MPGPPRAAGASGAAPLHCCAAPQSTLVALTPASTNIDRWGYGLSVSALQRPEVILEVFPGDSAVESRREDTDLEELPLGFTRYGIQDPHSRLRPRSCCHQETYQRYAGRP